MRPDDTSVLYTCVTDGSTKYDYQASVWAKTLLTLGGCSPTEIVVHTVGPRTPLLEELERLEVRVVPVRPFERRYPHSYPLALLESETLAAADHVVLCDCDLAFAGDLTPWIAGDELRAKMVDLARPPIALWRRIFEAGGFRGEPKAALPTNEDVPTYENNFNGGLYIFPQAVFRSMREVWPRWYRWLIGQTGLLAELGEYGFHVFQISFGLAMEELGLVADRLPVWLNFPTHLPYPDREGHDVEPVVLHYHDRIDDSGYLLKVGIENIDRATRRVNRVLANGRRESYERRGGPVRVPVARAVP